MPLKDVEKMGRDEFSLKAKLNVPLKLYKYLFIEESLKRFEVIY